ncbi:uncharacterized protein BDV14DRAFT_198909 [Aspergillus stella-maris]|uniref:uncharacterized protein n=1 Tax=Aspergillus stella-maris TaxID=1810926 RepID=UPI003CCCF9FB
MTDALDVIMDFFSPADSEESERSELRRLYSHGLANALTKIFRPYGVMDAISGNVTENTVWARIIALQAVEMAAAAYLGKLDHLKYHLDMRRDYDPYVDKHAMPLMAAAYAGRKDIVEFLLKRTGKRTHSSSRRR